MEDSAEAIISAATRKPERVKILKSLMEEPKTFKDLLGIEDEASLVFDLAVLHSAGFIEYHGKSIRLSKAGEELAHSL